MRNGKRLANAAEQSDRRLISEEELAARTGVSARTWQDWRLRRKGPQFIKCGRLVRYDLVEVARWLTGHTVATEEPAAR
jgi:predicted DNA-binding transcriptional regulator AlpA